jgi:hypothetical protein
MIENQILKVDEALGALVIMKKRKRRFPCEEATLIFNGLLSAE